uniref:Uncharacterized protein n=1 Tax=Octopus bimaculoides TaxID=37653 RepID=A0A0L8H804_OCTBM
MGEIHGMYGVTSFFKVKMRAHTTRVCLQSSSTLGLQHIVAMATTQGCHSYNTGFMRKEEETVL